MDYMYSADINPTEHVIDYDEYCGNCDYEATEEVVVAVGHSTTTWDWECPKCSRVTSHEMSNEKLFDE